MSDDNIWSEGWGEQGEDWSGGGGLAKALSRGEALGATVYELGRGNFGVYHFHHRWEELLIVLAGRPTLRTPAGSRVLEPGDVVHFPIGRGDGGACPADQPAGALSSADPAAGAAAPAGA